jgi:hypothetical protein
MEKTVVLVVVPIPLELLLQQAFLHLVLLLLV